MEAASRTLWSSDSLLFTCFVLVPCNTTACVHDFLMLHELTIIPNVDEQERDASSAARMFNGDEKDIDIIATYSDVSGTIRTSRVKMKDLSASWVLENPINVKGSQPQVIKLKESYKTTKPLEKNVGHSTDDNQLQEVEVENHRRPSWSPVKSKRQMLRQKRRELRTAELVRQDKEADKQKQATAAIASLKNINIGFQGKYSIWRRDYENPNSDSTLKLMRDQIIMAKVYANIAKSKNKTVLYNSLLEHVRESLYVIGYADSDTELHPGSLDRAKAMGHALTMAKDELYDCYLVARKLRAMLQPSEDNLNSLKKKSSFLIQLAAKTVPKPLHCLTLQLAADYYIHGYQNKKDPEDKKLEDPSLYHYAIFSDNVLATSVVVNSTVLHANLPEKHVFHVVTDKLNFAAMRMWFMMNTPENATVEVKNVDDFKWLNSSYCSVLRQLESVRIKDYYFKANHASSLSAGADHLKYRNPKYLSMLNHLRFYLPEVYPKLDKILFLDDDIVVQKDLTPLWDVDLQGMVNGAVETCKESFHRFDKYLNFSNPIIIENFDPNACGWAFGMNIFDLKEWRKRNITAIYHHWQDLNSYQHNLETISIVTDEETILQNEDRTLWKLGTLPPGLITFHNLTHPLDRKWHVLGLGYDPALNKTAIEDAAVIHYNGNYKPWLDLAVAKYKSYWSKYVSAGNYYLQLCNMSE
ncbi:hypothetical protein V6N13_085596 [Hibiscus sabdariffa]|uniref:Hexosyltransferase n=1 Tax=Hibiscus sabdariffa TaxID=183260 RepID=A0ABR2D3T8_9ROSI